MALGTVCLTCHVDFPDGKLNPPRFVGKSVLTQGDVRREQRPKSAGSLKHNADHFREHVIAIGEPLIQARGAVRRYLDLLAPLMPAHE